MSDTHAPSPVRPKLAPDEYYLDEHGRVVFTSVYHLRRGSCCGSGCRHCPWRGASDSGPVTRSTQTR